MISYMVLLFVTYSPLILFSAGTVKPTRSPLAQVAALPVRRSEDGCEILLITSRETRRWIIPKGWPMKGRKDHDAAAQEALDEAGVVGKVSKHPIGGYTYDKRLGDRTKPCRVMVYRLDVERELDGWAERDQRVRRWYSPAQAADLVSEPNLAALLRNGIEEIGV